jgi:uncharacterized Zn finger protein
MYGGWRPYVSVAQRRAKASRYAATLSKQGKALRPITLAGRTIAKTFWGKAWCDNLESYSDFENRLPRGRTYVRNGSVIDLQISAGKVEALVSGSEIYQVKIQIDKLNARDWQAITRDCSQAVDSLLDLLQGRLSKGVMQRLTRQKDGLFPSPKEIKINCSCPDWAWLCKHAAAVLYGVGSRLDEEPELLFTLRGVDHQELVSQAVAGGNLDQALSGGGRALAEDDLGALFGIDLDDAGRPAAETPVADPPTSKTARRKRAASKRPTSKTETTGAEKATTRSKAATAVGKKAASPKKATARAAANAAARATANATARAAVKAAAKAAKAAKAAEAPAKAASPRATKKRK